MISTREFGLTEMFSNDLLLARRARRDPAAVDEVLRRLWPQVRRAVYLILGPHPEAEDMTHQCLLEIMESIGNYHGAGSLEGWARKIVYRVVMRGAKRMRRRERTFEDGFEEGAISRSNPEREAVSQRLSDILLEHLRLLPVERQTTLVLRLIYEYSVAEVAEITGVRVNTTRGRIREGLRQLRESIARDARLDELLGEGNNDYARLFRNFA